MVVYTRISFLTKWLDGVEPLSRSWTSFSLRIRLSDPQRTKFLVAVPAGETKDVLEFR